MKGKMNKMYRSCVLDVNSFMGHANFSMGPNEY